MIKPICRLALTACLLSGNAFAHREGKAAKASPKEAEKFIAVFRGKDLSAMDDAIATLAAMGPKIVPLLVKSLSDPLPMVRSQVAGVITRVGAAAKAAVPALTHNLANGDSDVRWNSANTLGAIGPASRSALPALEKMTHDPLPPLAEAARAAVAKIK